MASSERPQNASPSNAQEYKQENSGREKQEECSIPEEVSFTHAQNADERSLRKSDEDFEFNDDSLNKECLTSCLQFLCDNLTVDGVIVHLQKNNILNEPQVDTIHAKETRNERNQILVDIVRQYGPEAFSCFMKSLTETDQKNIFSKLIKERKAIAERKNLSYTFNNQDNKGRMVGGPVYGGNVYIGDYYAAGALPMWATKLMSTTKKCSLESLIREEELGQLENIRVNKIPEQIGQIGKGAYGKVLLFKLEDGSLRAGKKPKINLENNSPEEESQLKRYLSNALGEIKILHQLDHERVIKFYGFYLDQSQMIIFMEAMIGSVKDEINEKGYLSEVKAMNYIIQAVEGLVYLHSRRPAIVHRDIKCENLLLTAEYNVKLADFGLAINLIIDNGSKTNLSTAPKSFVGTHLFHAPEIIQTVNKPEAYGRNSDIWSLACTLVQMISAEPPYKNLSLIELIQRSSVTSLNPLKYSGDLLLPTASNEMKKLLDSMFIIDYKLRPSADKVLALAHDVAKNITTSEFGSRKKFNNEIPLFHSIENNHKAAGATGLRNLGVVDNAESADLLKSMGNLFKLLTPYNESSNNEEYRSIPKVEENFSSYRKEAELGHANAQWNLGNMYFNGQSVPQSYEEAVKWFRKAAEQGHANAQWNMGNVYYNGEGVTQSNEEAFKWYRKSAELGFADSQCCLGILYTNGKGIPHSYEEAVKWFRKAAGQGHVHAQFIMGSVYDEGKGVPQSYEEAAKWYRKSANQGNAIAQNRLVNMYFEGKGVPQSNEEVIKWFRKPAEQGNAAAQNVLGDMFLNGRGVPQSDEGAVKWYRKSAEQGFIHGQCNLGDMYLNGRGVPQSDEEAVKWFRKSADQGNAIAQCRLGLMYDEGKGVPQSDEEAVKWYRKSADQGNENAQDYLVYMYCEDRGVPQSNEEVVKWFRKPAEQGNAAAQNILGDMYFNAKGVPQSDAEAVKWYTKSAEQGFLHGQANLGDMYLYGRGVPQSDEEAVKWFRKSADQGNENVQYYLVNMYIEGRGVPQSEEEAVEWFRKPAEQGNAAAQNILGDMYLNGKGVPQSDEEAVKWYTEAAEQGHEIAQFNLGWMYRNSRDIPLSEEEAVNWYTKSAEQGYARAQYNLGLMYRNGHGVPQSDEEAIKWFRKSAKQGDADAQSALKEMSNKGQGILKYFKRLMN